ncbi:hypothetical protein ACRE_023550 [Hapsidospora chrysogenum ATCC 11550]|uniref:Uncharacterized protein n=1 Tax=Hapsidospora chrysogenum (strain ATCC 11550 / CBS 779.69 / DSM 880 / IAM 14645 / JCM 23072 / IMI 49137) TaxID=857340 RepID=A0A086TBS2_HAPC1|nr:hypothetical protein ACRE_023550 [Hapsidospora chrysogenum ATCC 11550]
MPASSLFLLSLQPTTPIATFIPLLLLSSTTSPSPSPILIARPLRWIITPWMSDASPHETSTIETLKSTTWDLLLIFPTVLTTLLTDNPTLAPHIRASYTLTVGISSAILSGFAEKNKQLLHPRDPPPPLTGSSNLQDASRTNSSTKNLELSPDLLAWFSRPSTPRTAISMLNLLAFREGKLDSYKAYGRAFATDVGRRRGGVAKVVGRTVQQQQQQQEEEDKVWDEIAVAHYPSVWHFADMVISDDYQRANAEHRIGALRGTCILCCDELDAQVREGLEKAGAHKAKI